MLAKTGTVTGCDPCRLSFKRRTASSVAHQNFSDTHLGTPLRRDNNVVASQRFKDIIAEIRDLGFTPGAKLIRGRVPVKRRVDFNQGVDARILCRDPMYLRELSTICIKPLRIAFDHLGLKKPYTQAVRYACDVGLTELSNYMLYNFHDTPQDLFERMRLNVSLNEELGVRIFSFPMRYQPTDLPDRSHVGKNWNRYWLRSMQIILQATHGIVSGAPEFFRHAFGDTFEEFENILMRPQHFIFNRDWYERQSGRPIFDAYNAQMRKLSEADLAELVGLLSAHNPSQYASALKDCSNRTVGSLGKFYVPPPIEYERAIWDKQREVKVNLDPADTIPQDELVEDAGLYEDSVEMGEQAMRRNVEQPISVEAVA